ncbi:ABC transporter substrate-binding protein [Streptomyces sp. NPDC052042]|uniref:ABC transporter substrate-binding protein n=1 Tax=Streptomyces sp. NPDC052042 TaxID=3365683 RepID=UPI0037D16F15
MNVSPIRACTALAVGAALLLSGCTAPAEPAAGRTGAAAPSGHYPVTLDVVDDAGRKLTQTVEKSPGRVVVIGQALAELMIEFGLEDRIVGVGYLDNSYSAYADRIEKLPKISDQLPSKEAILARRPDLVLTMSFALKPDKIGEVPFWNARGVEVLPAVNYTVGRDLDSYYEDVRHVGEVFDVRKRTGAYIAEQKARIAAIARTAKKAGNAPRVLLVASGGRDTYDYYSPSLGLVDEMVNGAGGTYMELTRDTYAQLSLESIIAANPDKIIVTEFQQSDGEKSRNRLLRDPRLKNVTAIRNGDVMIADYTTSIRGSLALADLCEEIAVFVHPDLYPDA